MAESSYITTTSDQKPFLRQLVRNLPAILSGRLPDVAGIAHGFRSRLGYSILSLIVPNFDELGRGLPGADGDKWPPLSPATIANRRFGPGEKSKLKKEAGLKSGYRFPATLSPGGNLTLYKKVYAKKLAEYAMKQDMASAKAHAHQVAQEAVRTQGAKTKLQVFGGPNRLVQILVDTGRGRASLSPGTLTELGPDALHQKASPVVKTFRDRKGKKVQVTLASAEDQAIDLSKPDAVVVGTNVGYMGVHHRGKRLPKRRLWPENFPATWWQTILGNCISGLVRIGEIARGERPI